MCVLYLCRGLPCVSNNNIIQLPNGKHQRSCGYKSVFCLSGNHTFFFNTPCPTEATQINIATQGET